MPINFLYIDDEKIEMLKDLIESLEAISNGEISIDHQQVMESISAVVSHIRSHPDKYQGVVIDQDLTAESESGNKADYFGTTLAQHLRTEMAIQNIDALPLILLSNEHVIVESLEPDDSAKNLFDYVIKKTELRDLEIRSRAAKVLKALVEAYNLANSCRKDIAQDLDLAEVQKILSCDENIFKQIDSRFIDFVSSKANDPHALVGSIYSTLVQSAGILVTEVMLQTKLGIASDSADWQSIKGMLEQYKYKGMFSEIKERWWFSGVEDWWYDICENDVLQSLTCEQRVEFLKDYFTLENLKPITTTYPDGDQSEYLWVNCVLSGVPLDPVDALRARDPDAKVWEQPKYLDVKSFLNDINEPAKYKVHSDDKKKIKRLLARLKADANS